MGCTNMCLNVSGGGELFSHLLYVNKDQSWSWKWIILQTHTVVYVFWGDFSPLHQKCQRFLQSHRSCSNTCKKDLTHVNKPAVHWMNGAIPPENAHLVPATHFVAGCCCLYYSSIIWAILLHLLGINHKTPSRRETGRGWETVIMVID